MRTKGYKCFNIKCGSCIGKTLCGEPEDTALGCVNRVAGKPMTNADRIRAMSDEELAKIIEHELGCPVTGDCEKMSRDCKACWLDWLQQPAEEDKHENLD